MTVCYCATVNHYPLLKVAVSSLLINNPELKVLCFIETDIPPFEHPNVSFKNVKRLKKRFNEKSPNYNTRFSYMALMRLLFAYEVDDDKVLYLDTDTIVDGDLTELLNEDITDYDCAGCWEQKLYPYPYINSGMLLINIPKIKEKTDLLISMANSNTRWAFPDQDIINAVCKIKYIDSRWNFTNLMITDCPTVYHLAGYRDFTKCPLYPLWQTYEGKCLFR